MAADEELPEVLEEDIPSGAVEVIAKLGRKNNPKEPVTDDFNVEGCPQRVASVGAAYADWSGTAYWKEGVQFYVFGDGTGDDGKPERGAYRVRNGQLVRESYSPENPPELPPPVTPGGGDGAIQYNQGGEFAGDETAFAFRYPGFLGTGAGLPLDSRVYDEYRAGLFIPGNPYDSRRAWGIFGPNGYPLQSFEYRPILGQSGPWNVNHTPQSLNVNGGILPETRNVYASYFLLDPGEIFAQVWEMPDVVMGAGIGQIEIKLFCIGRYNGQVVGGQTKFLRFGVLMDEQGHCYPSGMADTATLTNTNETVNIGIGEQTMIVFQKVETFSTPSGRQSVRLVMRWEGNVDDVKVGMNVEAQYFSSGLFFNNPALNIAPEWLPRPAPPQFQRPDPIDVG